MTLLLSQDRNDRQQALGKLTACATLRQQKRNVLDYVTTACEAALHPKPVPSLLPLTVTIPGTGLSKAA